MPQVTREIHIDAPPDIVRRLIADPARRARWLDDPAADPVPDDTGSWTYTRAPDGQPPSRVRIELTPDGDGSRVRVIERTTEVEADTDEIVTIDSSRSLLMAA
jgi:uncharacterized protein YndB with AHSA1/START domain